MAPAKLYSLELLNVPTRVRLSPSGKVPRHACLGEVGAVRRSQGAAYSDESAAQKADVLRIGSGIFGIRAALHFEAIGKEIAIVISQQRIGEESIHLGSIRGGVLVGVAVFGRRAGVDFIGVGKAVSIQISSSAAVKNRDLINAKVVPVRPCDADATDARGWRIQGEHRRTPASPRAGPRRRWHGLSDG